MSKHQVTETQNLPTVTVTAGTYRGVAYAGTYPMAADFKPHAKKAGGFVTVVATADGQKQRVTVEGEGVGYTVNDQTAGEVEVDTVNVDDYLQTSGVRPEKTFTRDEAATKLGISKDALRKRIKRGTVQVNDAGDVVGI